MSMSDPIADFVARIRNGITARKSRIDIPSSKLKVRIAEILKQEGYLTAAEVVTTESRPVLQLSVRYDNHHKSPINGIRRSSTPGQRNYVGKDKEEGRYYLERAAALGHEGAIEVLANAR